MGIKSSLRLTQINTRLKDFVKRSFDIFVSLAILIFLAPFILLIAHAIQRDSPGPAFYRGARSGRGGKIFKILKFRTMYETQESYSGPGITAHDDPRITPLGRWLRDTKLNELPQFLNVLKGEMSLVGPRPEDPSIVETWSDDERQEILSVRPGITSPASVQFRDEEIMLAYKHVLQKYMKELSPDKMRLDQLYVHYRSFWLDLDILIWTLFILLPKVKVNTVPEELIFLGPITRLIRRHVSWLSIDLIVTLIAIGITGIVWRAFGPLNIGWLKAIGVSAGFALLFSLIGAAFGMNRITWSKAITADAYNLLPPWLIASTIAFIGNRVIGIFPPALILVASGLALAGFVLIRYRGRLITVFLSRILRHRIGTQPTRERVLIVGSGRTAEHIAWLLDHPTYAGKFQVVGFVDDDLLSQGMRIYGASILGTCKNIPELVQKHDVGLILLADHRLAYKEYQSISAAYEGTSVRIAVIPDIFGSLLGLSEALSAYPQDSNSWAPDDLRCIGCMAKYAPSGIEAELEK